MSFLTYIIEIPFVEKLQHSASLPSLFIWFNKNNAYGNW